MNPIFIDLETRSACDLPERGSWQYAADDTTRLLTVAWKDGDDEHVWLPGLSDHPLLSLTELHLPGVRVHVGGRVPAELVAVRNRPWVGHNTWTFDRLVWAECTDDCDPIEWIDTYPLALATGLPGGLDKIGNFLWGEGKYDAGKKALKKASVCSREPGDCEPENVPVGLLMLVAKYNVQDVRLTEALWKHLSQFPLQEPDVLATHRDINQRGCKIDRKFLTALMSLAEEAKDNAIQQIAVLTQGALPDKAAVQSRAQVLAWLDRMGYKFHSLKKDLVAKFLKDNQKDAVEPETSGPEEADAAPDNLPLVYKVLELRMQALRITGGKLDAALWSMDADDRARGMFVYWGAHTGRWAGRRIQLQNLPRPKDGVDTWALCKLYDEGRFNYFTIRDSMPIGDPLYPFLSVDDGAAALIRSIIVPDDPTETLITGDYAGIETLMTAWMAGEQKLLDTLWADECPYLRMAEMIVQKPRDQWPVYPDPKTGKPLPLKKHPYRQIVGKVPMLAAVYQVGGAKLEMYAAQFGHSLRSYGTTGKDCVLAFRRAHPMIAGEEAGDYNGVPFFRGGLWCQLNAAVLMTVGEGHTTYAGKCVFTREHGCLICTLPSGRRLTYRDAKVELVQPAYAKGTDKFIEAVTYWNPKYNRREALYGGKITENIVQAASRDIMAYAMVKLDAAGFKIVLHCHDEIGSSACEEGYPDFMRIMSTCPPWLTGVPLKVEGGCAPRYAKSSPPEVKEQVWRNGVRHA